MKKNLLAAFLMMWLAGCAHREPPPLANPSEQTGQLLWKSTESSLVTEAFLQRSSPDGTRLLLYKGMANPLLDLTVQGGEFWARGPLARHGAQGLITDAPSYLIPWLAFLHVYQAIPSLDSGFSEIHGRDFRAQIQKQSRQLVSMTVATEQPGALLQFRPNQ